MIQRDLNVVTVEGELQGTEIGMSIDKAAEHLIMERLIRLYSDPILAFIREMSTNAFDAIVESVGGIARDAVLDGTAGRPIEVTLPTKLAPMFIVRDSGIGMSYDDILTVYSRYGASTKRESNDYNGALGFGCKSPLAYTPTFTVQSVKDGHRITVQVGRTPKGGGKMTVVEGDPSKPTNEGGPCPTTEPNGTTIIIPVRAEDIERVETKARAFFRYWKPGTVFVNGEQPAHVETVLRLTPTLAVIEGDQDMILMANVAYPTAQRLMTGLKSGYALLAEVPTGDVEFTPSREGLENTPHTAARVQQALREFKTACKGAIQKKINEAPNKHAAMDAMIYWRAALPREARAADDLYTYKGLKLPWEWREPKQSGDPWPFLLVDVNSYVESRYISSEKVTASQMRNQMFVTGYTPSKFTTAHKRKLEMWRTATATTTGATEYVLMRADQIPAEYKPWIDAGRIVSWEHVRTTYKLPTARSTGTGTSYKTIMGSYDEVWTEAGFAVEVKASDIRKSEPIFWFNSNHYYAQEAIKALPLLHPKYTVVKLPANRINKFLRDFPTATRVLDAVDAAYQKWQATITADQLVGLAMLEEYRYSRASLRLLQALDPAKVDDPALKQAIRVSKLDLTMVEQCANLFQKLLAKKLPIPTWSDPLKKYPLANARYVSAADQLTLKHLVLYVNAVYAANTTP